MHWSVLKTKNWKGSINAKDAYNALITTFPSSNYEKDSRSVMKSIDKEIQKLT